MAMIAKVIWYIASMACPAVWSFLVVVLDRLRGLVAGGLRKS
jgi:hypothetical protein